MYSKCSYMLILTFRSQISPNMFKHKNKSYSIPITITVIIINITPHTECAPGILVGYFFQSVVTLLSCKLELECVCLCESCDVSTALMLRILVLWDVTLCTEFRRDVVSSSSRVARPVILGPAGPSGRWDTLYYPLNTTTCQKVRFNMYTPGAKLGLQH
jgi:hypothetical protein